MLKIILSLIVGTTILVGAVAVNIDDIIADTKIVVNSANLRQLATALELYYSDNEHYPLVIGGDALIKELASYLRNKPLDNSVFNYEALNNGQDYDLSLN